MVSVQEWGLSETTTTDLNLEIKNLISALICACDDSGISLMMMAERWSTKHLYKYLKCISFSPFYFYILFFFFLFFQKGVEACPHFQVRPGLFRRQFIGETFQQCEKGSDKCRTFKMYYSPISFSCFCTRFAIQVIFKENYFYAEQSSPTSLSV